MTKFAMKAASTSATITAAATRSQAETGIRIVRTQSRAASIHASFYSNRMSFIRRAVCKVGAVDVVDMVDAADVVGAADTVDLVSMAEVADADVVDMRRR